MEADWEFEIGPSAPIIDARWSGFIDLTTHPDYAAQLPEAAQLPALAEALILLNAHSSPVWTSKCDLWQVDEPVDPDELDATPEAITTAKACYIDLLARQLEQWATPQQLERDCTDLCNKLHLTRLRCCRADLIIRRAVLAPEQEALGVTAYLTACGSSKLQAAKALAHALAAFADTVSRA